MAEVLNKYRLTCFWSNLSHNFPSPIPSPSAFKHNTLPDTTIGDGSGRRKFPWRVLWTNFFVQEKGLKLCFFDFRRNHAANGGRTAAKNYFASRFYYMDLPHQF